MKKFVLFFAAIFFSSCQYGEKQVIKKDTFCDSVMNYFSKFKITDSLHAKQLCDTFRLYKVEPIDVLHYCKCETDTTKKWLSIAAAGFNMKNNDNLEENTEYYGAILYDVKKFAQLINALKKPEHRVFMDVGSGNGEKLFAALCLGFESALGVEYSKPIFDMSQDILHNFVSQNKVDIELADAQKINSTFYQKADFIYMYIPIKEERKMSKLYNRILTNMKDGAILLEVCMAYYDDLSLESGWKIPTPDFTFFALKKQNGKLLGLTNLYEMNWQELVPMQF